MIEIIIATGLIGVILLVLGFGLDNDKHQVLKVLSIFFAVFIILMLGKFANDSKEVCVRELNFTNKVYVYGNNFSGYHWDYDMGAPTNPTNYELFHIKEYPEYKTSCYNQTTSSTPLTVYTSTLWYFRIVFIYVFGFVIFLVGSYLIKLNKLKRAP